MRAALVEAGLFEREASAMVSTWRDSWFQESGLRVLYVLPHSWTDRTLPVTIIPQPRELARGMGGPAERITPSMEGGLLKRNVHYRETDEANRQQVVENTRSLGLGRFAEATTRRLAGKFVNREFNRLSWELLEAASKREAQPKALAAN